MVSAIPTIAKAIPRLPAALTPLVKVAHNLAWAWHPEMRAPFARLQTPLPVGPVAALYQATNLDELAADPSFLAEVATAERALDVYLASQGRLANTPGLTAYFCAEFGLHETFPVYSGGLGILAGDHCKEASDLSLPFVAVGLFYRRGFFHQMIDREGRQEHEYPTLASDLMPVERTHATVEVPLPGRNVKAAVWRVQVGRIPLLMLDTDLPENQPQDRPITSQLYTAGRDMRLHQEIVLGVGGVRALAALGIEPTTWHLNEGHSALLLLERIRRGESAKDVQASSVITIHTPVAAGNERFDAGHALRTLAPLLEGGPITATKVAELGLDSESDPKTFDMTAFALRLTRAANGVSLLHGTVADATWRPVTKRKVIGVTNGVHMPTWLGPEIQALVGEARPWNLEVGPTMKGKRPAWDGAASLSDDNLWNAHQAQNERLMAFARARLARQFARHGAGPDELAGLLAALDPEAFTIGFARRFATYKRASLLFSDERRLLKLLNGKGRPVQVIFAGKAHPADRDGQKLIAQIYAKTQSPKFRGKVVLLEEYDMATGAHLVQGVDLWLNNPRRPLEASGTSGMKAAANGVPNLSVLDGWWDEAYEPGNGFAIGDRKPLDDVKAQDKRDADALYEALEQTIVPMYYHRDRGLPREWIAVMRRSLATSVWPFSTARMLDDYVAEMYR